MKNNPKAKLKSKRRSRTINRKTIKKNSLNINLKAKRIAVLIVVKSKRGLKHKTKLSGQTCQGLLKL
jgi:hypothetical protein